MSKNSIIIKWENGEEIPLLNPKDISYGEDIAEFSIKVPYDEKYLSEEEVNITLGDREEEKFSILDYRIDYPKTITFKLTNKNASEQDILETEYEIQNFMSSVENFSLPYHRVMFWYEESKYETDGCEFRSANVSKNEKKPENMKTLWVFTPDERESSVLNTFFILDEDKKRISKYLEKCNDNYQPRINIKTMLRDGVETDKCYLQYRKNKDNLYELHLTYQTRDGMKTKPTGNVGWYHNWRHTCQNFERYFYDNFKKIWEGENSSAELYTYSEELEPQVFAEYIGDATTEERERMDIVSGENNYRICRRATTAYLTEARWKRTRNVVWAVSLHNEYLERDSVERRRIPLQAVVDRINADFKLNLKVSPLDCLAIPNNGDTKISARKVLKLIDMLNLEVNKNNAKSYDLKTFTWSDSPTTYPYPFSTDKDREGNYTNVQYKGEFRKEDIYQNWTLIKDRKKPVAKFEPPFSLLLSPYNNDEVTYMPTRTHLTMRMLESRYIGYNIYTYVTAGFKEQYYALQDKVREAIKAGTYKFRYSPDLYITIEELKRQFTGIKTNFIFPINNIFKSGDTIKNGLWKGQISKIEKTPYENKMKLTIKNLKK